jgi:uncharacterized membrane protein
MKFGDEEKTRALLVEYTATQNSAQHHDSLVWTTTGMVWGAELVLLGFVIQNINSSEKAIVIVACILALVLLSYLWVSFISFRKIRNQKYERCKAIEDMFGLTQHTSLNHCKGIGLIAFSCVMVVFCATWVWVLFWV